MASRWRPSLYWRVPILLRFASRWQQLSGRDRVATVTQALLVPIVSLSLASLGFQRTVRWLARTARPNRPDSRDAIVVMPIVDASQRVRRMAPWAGRCLARTLALWWQLRRQGVEAKLHIGLRQSSGQLEAHAWLVNDGRVLNERPAVLRRFRAVMIAPLPD